MTGKPATKGNDSTAVVQPPKHWVLAAAGQQTALHVASAKHKTAEPQKQQLAVLLLPGMGLALHCNPSEFLVTPGSYQQVC